MYPDATDKQLSDGDFGDFPSQGLHVYHHKQLGFSAIIALYSTQRGPALGGCRLYRYASWGHAVQDAMRLAKGMAYKTAAADLPLGGGKAVIWDQQGQFASESQRSERFRLFAEHVHGLNGQYITAVDVGTESRDMDGIARYTPFVTCLSSVPGFSWGNPSPLTALGVFEGIKAAIASVYGRASDSGSGIRVALQGLGQVGWALGDLLHHWGAQLWVCDTATDKVQCAQQAWGATPVHPDAIHACEVDVWAPCAMGGVITSDRIPELGCRIVAGGANNVLQDPHTCWDLHTRHIVYVPDYLINAGGVIHAYAQYTVKQDPAIGRAAETRALHQCLGIGKRVEACIRRSQVADTPPLVLLDRQVSALLDPTHFPGGLSPRAITEPEV